MKNELKTGKSERTPSPSPQPGTAPTKFTGVHADNYEIAYKVCGVFSLRKLARDLGVRAEPITVAEAYARGYLPAYRQAPFEGRLDGVLAKAG